MLKNLLTSTFLLLMFLANPFPVNAEVTKWAQNGAPVSIFDALKFSPAITSDGAGGALIVWEDYRNTPLPADIFVQRININGTPIFKNNSGIIIDKKATVGSAADKRLPSAIGDGNGNAFVVWEDYQNGENNINIHIQKIDISTGNPQWLSDKVVCDAVGNQRFPQIILSNTSPVEAIVVWEDHRNSTYSQIYAQKIDENGDHDPNWTSNGIPIASTTTNQRSPAISPDGSSGAVLVWADWRNISTTGLDIYGQRIDSNGVGQWSSDKMLITSANEDQMFPAIAGDGQNHFVVTWEDYRTGIYTSDIYARGIDNNNTSPPLFDDRVISSATDADVNAADQRFPRVAYSTDDNGFIILWEDYRNDPADYTSDIYAHKITYNGNVLWATNGEEIIKTTGTQDFISIASGDTKGVIATWEDSRSNSLYDIYATPLPIPGSISIAGGASNTLSSTVNLSLWLSSFGSTPSEMCISNDKVIWSCETYAATRAEWPLTTGDGSKTVYAQFKDSSTPAQLSPVYSDDITLVNMTINSGADYTTSLNVTLYLSAIAAQMRFSDDSSSWTGIAWEPYAATRAYTLPGADGPKTVYAQFGDLSGNIVASSSASITLDATPPAVTSTSPSDGATGVELNPSITITLNDIEGIDSSTITSANIYLKQGITLIDASLGYSTATLTATLTPNNKLSINTTYTVYVTGVKDIAGNIISPDPYFFSFTTMADSTPPTGTITINNGDLYYNNLAVSLTISATDDLNGVLQMRFSADGTSWKDWKSYNTIASFNIPSGDGLKKVYVQFQDGVGNVPNTYSNYDEIVLDMTLPTGTISINSGATYTNSTPITLTLSCTDANGCSQMQFSNDNSTWSTAENYAATKAWVLAGGDGTKTVYVKFKDNAGNWSGAYSATIILDTIAPGPGSGVTPSILLDGAMVTSGQTYYSYSIIVASWTPLSDTSAGLQGYRIAIGTTAGGTDILNWTGTAVPSYATADISSDHFGKTLYISVKAIDNLGTESSILNASFVYTPADINSKEDQGDGRVDGFDLGKLGIEFGSSGQNLTADINRDGKVDGNDLIVLGTNFGKVKQ